MPIKLSDALKITYQDAAKNLTGSARWKFIAGIVESLRYGGLSYCTRELGWDPKMMHKGRQQLESGLEFADRSNNPGRKWTEERLPILIEDLKQILKSQSQKDATFQIRRLYTRLSVREVRTQLIVQHGLRANSPGQIRSNRCYLDDRHDCLQSCFDGV